MTADTDTGAPPPKIELFASDVFHRNKRNFLLACAITIVLALADHEDGVSIPGMGSHATLQPVWAFALLLATTLYFGVQYLLEFLVVYSMNSPGVAGKSTDALERSFEKQAASLDEQTADLIMHVTSITQRLASIPGEIGALTPVNPDSMEIRKAVAEAIAAYPGTSPDANFQEIIATRIFEHLVSMEGTMAQFNASNLARIPAGVETVRALGVETQAAFALHGARIDDLRKQFQRLSTNIHASQRAGLILDAVVPAIIGLAAYVACIFSMALSLDASH